jgi:hypothetical protein
MKPNEAAKAIWDKIAAPLRKPREEDLVADGWLTAAAFADSVGLSRGHATTLLNAMSRKGELDKVEGLSQGGDGRYRCAVFFRPKALRPAETGASKAPGR